MEKRISYRTNFLTKHVSIYFAICIMIGCATNSSAQENERNSVEVTANRSFGLFTATYEMKGNEYGGSFIYHINTSNQQTHWMNTLNVKSLDLKFNYKKMDGVTTDAINFFGDSYALVTGINMSLLRLGKTEVLFAPGFGLLFAEETYFTNKNPVLSSHINFIIDANLKWQVPVTSSLKFNAGVSILHYSNGAFRVANNGVNIADIAVALLKMSVLINQIITPWLQTFPYKNIVLT